MKRETREITGVGDWLDWRRRDMTASPIGALFDAHPFITRESLAAEKRHEPHQGAIPPGSIAMGDGNLLEHCAPAAIERDRRDYRLVKATTYHRLPEHRLGCTPDFWLHDLAGSLIGLLQFKTCSPAQWEKWRGAPPLAYTLQTLTELLVTDQPRGVLAVMVRTPGYPVHYYDVPRHAAAEARILAAVAAWWEAHEVGLVAAPVSLQEIAAEVDDGSYRDLSTSNELPELLAERETLKADADQRRHRLAEIDAAIKTAIGPARTAWLPGWTLTYQTQHRNEKLMPAADFRVLRVKRTEEHNEEDNA